MPVCLTDRSLPNHSSAGLTGVRRTLADHSSSPRRTHAHTLADLSRARRDLIATKALDDGPFLTRLWYHHLFWLCSFLKSAITIKARGIGFLVCRQWYRAADRLFGGTREAAFCEKLNRNAERLREKSERLKAERQTRAELRFERETLYQALTNPHFVATPHTRQDR
jgi:hypothetical protein